MVVSLVTMARLELSTTRTMGPNSVYFTFAISCFMMTAANVTPTGSLEISREQPGSFGKGIMPLSLSKASSTISLKKRYAERIRRNRLNGRTSSTLLEFQQSKGHISQHPQKEHHHFGTLENPKSINAIEIKSSSPLKFQSLGSKMKPTKLLLSDLRKEKERYKQKYQDLLHRINVSLSRKRLILSESLDDAYKSNLGSSERSGETLEDTALYESSERGHYNQFDNVTYAEALSGSSDAWVVSNQAWPTSNRFLPVYGKGVSISGSHRKRGPRSLDNISINNSTDEGKPDDVLLTEALYKIEGMKSQDSPCKEGGQKFLVLKNVRQNNTQLFHRFFADLVNKTVQMANTISDLLLFSTSPPESSMGLFYAMTQSLVETGPMVRGCAIAITLGRSPYVDSSTPSPNQTSATSASPGSAAGSADPPSGNSLFPYSYRTPEGQVVVTELSKYYEFTRAAWYIHHANKSTEGLMKPRSRILTNKTDIGKLYPILGKWTKAVSVSAEDGFWTVPYYDCLLKNWVIQYSVPFYQQNGSVPELKGVVLLEADFESIPINQCAYDGGLFSGTHRCNKQTTECKPIPSSTLQWGSYRCVCKEGYTFPTAHASSNNKFFDGRAVERAYLEFVRNISSNYSNEFNCMPMSTTPSASTPLGAEKENIVSFDFLVRGIPLGIQSFCMTVSLVIAVVILCFRKTKVMRTSIWVLLEMLLLGAILLYATVVIQYFEPTTMTCLLLPWFREMGFAIVYGVLVLKIYRILAEFQSRKAHRVHVRDKDLLKYLAVIMIVVIAYMSAWTAVNMDHLRNNSTILERLYTKKNLAYTLCRAMWWDYVIEAGEFIFLCFGIYMCYCVRSAPTEYSEGRFITGAICYEAVVSTIFYILRHMWWYEMHPDHLFLMFFLRCQLTVTVVLLIILGPKLWYAHRPPDEDHGRSRAYSQSDVQDSSSPETMKLNVGISSNGDVEVGEISLTEMDPEDIRAELKRLYTQLQIYKTKTMRKDNPHISKRRGGRKQTHRRFSLQAFHHKHRHHHDHDHEHEMSKTPEESTNSAEAMAFTIEPSVKEDPNEGRSAPSVSFKPGHK